MRRTVVAMGMAAAIVATAPALAQTGAQSGTAMQPGAWGARGWQAGAAAPGVPAYAPVPVAAPTYAATPAYAPAPVPAYAPSTAYAPSAGYAPQIGYMPAGYPGSAWDNRRRPLERGQKLKRGWRSPIYTVRDYDRYGLPAPGPGMRWIRYFDDAALVDASDRVVDARGGIDWNGRLRSARGTGGRPTNAQPAYPVPGVQRTVTRNGNETVTTETRTEIVPGGGDAYAYGPGATFTPGTRTTVTTTTEETPRSRRPTRRRSWPMRR